MIDKNKNFLSPILETLQKDLEKEGIFLRENNQEVKPLKAKPFEEKAMSALNGALENILRLRECKDDLSQAARLVEKIQMAATDAERAAFSINTPLALKCFKTAQKIAAAGRAYLHELKQVGKDAA